MAKALILTDKPDSPLVPKKGMLKGRPKLATLRGIKSEMARMYRATFYTGDIIPEDYTRAMYGLRIIAELTEAVEFETRLKELEDKTP